MRFLGKPLSRLIETSGVICDEGHIQLRLLYRPDRDASEQGIFRATGGTDEVAGDTEIATEFTHRLWKVVPDAGVDCE